MTCGPPISETAKATTAAIAVAANRKRCIGKSPHGTRPNLAGGIEAGHPLAVASSRKAPRKSSAGLSLCLGPKEGPPTPALVVCAPRFGLYPGIPLSGGSYEHSACLSFHH